MLRWLQGRVAAFRLAWASGVPTEQIRAACGRRAIGDKSPGSSLGGPAGRDSIASVSAKSIGRSTEDRRLAALISGANLNERKRRIRRHQGYRRKGLREAGGCYRPAAKHYPRAGRFTTLLRVLGSRKCAPPP